MPVVTTETPDVDRGNDGVKEQKKSIGLKALMGPDINKSGDVGLKSSLLGARMNLAITQHLKKRVEQKLNFLQLKKIEKEKKRKAENSCMDWFNFIIELPFDWIRKLTIPPCEAAHYDKWFVIVWPYFGILVAELIATKQWPTTY